MNLLFAYFSATLAFTLASVDVSEKFISNEIVKDLGLKSAPLQLVEVKWSDGVEAKLGNELTPTQVQSKPTLKWNGPDGFYTVLMTDPDATSRANPIFREFRHWLVMNAPNGDVDAGDTIFDYIGAGAPEKTGLHRYVFLVFEQDGYIDVGQIAKTKNCSREGRPKTQTAKLIEEYGLKQPKYGNFYEAQFDSYVLELRKQLSGC